MNSSESPSFGSVPDQDGLGIYRAVVRAISEFCGQFRPEYAPSFSVCELYDLFPEKERLISISVKSTWPDDYPYYNNGGVYIQFGEQMGIARIGKASSKRTFDGRLWDYFCYVDRRRKNWACRIRENWPVMPRFILIVAKDAATPEWHIPALEAFLLDQFQPPNNRF